MKEKEISKVFQTAEKYFKSKQYDDAIKFYKKIIDQKNPENLNEKNQKIYNFVFTQIARSYWNKIEPKEALKYFQKSLAIHTKRNEQERIAGDYLNIGGVQCHLGNNSESIKYNEKAYNIFKSLNKKKEMNRAISNLANNYYYLGNFKKALKLKLEVIPYFEEIKDLELLAKDLNTIAVIYSKLSNYEKAIAYSLQSLKIKEKLNDPYFTSSSMLNLGVFYEELGNDEKALEYYQKTLKIRESIKDKKGISAVLNNIGSLLMDQQKEKEALVYFQRSLEIKREFDDKQGLLIVLGNIGSIYCENLKEYDKALNFTEQALTIADEIGNVFEATSIKQNLAEIMIKKREFSKAESYLKGVGKLLRKEKNNRLLLINFKLYSELFFEQKKYKQSVEFHRKYSELNARIFTEESSKKIAEMQTKYETEKKEKEAEIYRLKNIELEEKNTQILNQKQELENTIEKLHRSEIRYNFVAEELIKGIGTTLIGKSEVIKNIIELVSVVARSDTTNVLITGESGTGKEIVAHNIHKFSKRKKNTFYAVNSSAIPETLFESQFFGHEKNAFTGANKAKVGWFEIADSSTLFLDEIGTMSFEQQAKLLRVLEEKKIVRVGSYQEIKIDVRVISATNTNLLDMVREKKFRSDLYHRLATFVIDIPPLRERKEDILMLLRHFTKMFSLKLNKKIKNIENQVELNLLDYDFPGNVRELRNIVERAILISDSSTLRMKDFVIPKIGSDKENLEGIIPLEEMEKKMILKALKATGFNRRQAAKLLKVDRRVVERRIKKFGIKVGLDL